MSKIALAHVPDTDIGPLSGFKYVPPVKGDLSDPKGEEARFLRAQYRVMCHGFYAGRQAAEALVTPETIVDALEWTDWDGPVVEAITETFHAEAMEKAETPKAPYPVKHEDYVCAFACGVQAALDDAQPKIKEMMKAAGTKLTEQRRRRPLVEDEESEFTPPSCPHCGGRLMNVGRVDPTTGVMRREYLCMGCGKVVPRPGPRIFEAQEVIHEHAVKCPRCGATTPCEDVTCTNISAHERVCLSCKEKEIPTSPSVEKVAKTVKSQRDFSTSDYRHTVASIAEEILAEHPDEDDWSDAVHESVDSNQYVIYNAGHSVILDASDNEPDGAEVSAMSGPDADWRKQMGVAAYMAMEADVFDALRTLHTDREEAADEDADASEEEEKPEDGPSPRIFEARRSA